MLVPFWILFHCFFFFFSFLFSFFSEVSFQERCLTSFIPPIFSFVLLYNLSNLGFISREGFVCTPFRAWLKSCKAALPLNTFSLWLFNQLPANVSLEPFNIIVSVWTFSKTSAIMKGATFLLLNTMILCYYLEHLKIDLPFHIHMELHIFNVITLNLALGTPWYD